MANTSIFLLIICSFEVIFAIPSKPALLAPQHRSDYEIQAIGNEAVSYEYQIVPKAEYTVMETNAEFPLLESALSPVTALMSLGSAVISVTNWLVINGGLMFLGMAIIFGFCAFTPFCTLTINTPFAIDLGNVFYLDDIEYYFHEAYNKLHDMQSYLY